MKETKINNFEEFLDNKFSIKANFKISKKSEFIDQIWDFTDEEKQRLNSVGEAKLKIKWFEYKEFIPSNLIEATKIVCYFFVKHPQVLSKRSITKKGFKANTTVQRIKCFLDFLKSLCLNQTIELIKNQKLCLISTLKELSIEELQKEAHQTNRYEQEIKSILTALCNPTIQKYLSEKVEWNSTDIKQLKFGNKMNDNTNHTYSDQPLNDSLFIFVSKKATKDVVTFLKLLGVEINYTSNEDFNNEPYTLKYNYSFKEIFESYVNLRIKDREYSEHFGQRKTIYINHKEFRMKFGISTRDFMNDLVRFQRAAIYIVCQFTGVRYSEAVSFQTGCLKKIKEGLWVIKGTITKGEDINKKEGNDEWVACPIVRDAVNVLEEIQRFTFNSFLISPTYSVYLKQKELPYSNRALNGLLQLYTEQIDTERRFIEPKYKMSTHRLRHTLARQLIKAKLGIPYISYHLKHLHSQIAHVQNYINDVTLGYGNISKELFNNPTAINYVKKEMVYDIYHPDSPIAGKNSEDFKARRQAYFQGMQAEGWEMDEIMEFLQAKGVPFADVGLGYCGGKKELILSDGTKEQPPCIGQLKCNPVRCHNALIPKSKIPHWINVYKHNKNMLKDPQFAHAKQEHQSFLDEAKLVLTYLDVSIEEL